MTQLVLIGLVGIAGWLLWREFGRAIVTRRPPPSGRKREATPLELDPKTGVYRPPDREKH